VRLFWLAIVLVSCGGTQRVDDGPQHGVVEAEPSMETLPSMSAVEEGLSEKMRFALLLTEQSFELRDPHPAPVGASVAELEQWSRSELHRWLSQKNQLVEAARAELDLAAEETRAQRILAGALVGLMYEDVARVLLDVPTPREIANEEPEIAEAYRYVVEAQASPYLDHASAAYRACALNGAELMRRWSHYCSGRRERLPLSHNARAQEQREGTTVEVIVE